MDAGSVIGLVIISIAALIILGIGISQMLKKEEPVGFYNTIDPPKKDEISNISEWNKKHGLLWIVYGIIIEACYWIAYFMPGTVLQAVCLIGGILLPLPCLVIYHNRLVQKYSKTGK